MAQREADQVTGTRWIDYRTDVPRWLAAEIGRIAVEWSRLEAHFEEAIRLLMPVDIHIGRIATTGMNMRSRTAVAANLVRAHVFYGKLGKDIQEELAAICNDLARRETDISRNKLVHGLWGKVKGNWELVRNSGTRSVAPVGKIPRPLLPQREQMTLKKTRAIRQEIKNLSTRMEAFCAKIEAGLAPLPYESRRQIRLSRPNIRKKK